MSLCSNCNSPARYIESGNPDNKWCSQECYNKIGDIMDLPKEVVWGTMFYLDLNSLIRFCGANSRFRGVCNSRSFKQSYSIYHRAELTDRFDGMFLIMNIPVNWGFVRKWIRHVIAYWDPSGNNNMIYQMAVRGGNTDIVTFLLEDHRIRPDLNIDNTIVYAADHNYWDIVRLVLADYRISQYQRSSFMLAYVMRQGDINSVRFWLADPITDQYMMSADALRDAISYNANLDILNLIVNDGRTLRVLADNMNSIIRYATKVSQLSLLMKIPHIRRGINMGTLRYFAETAIYGNNPDMLMYLMNELDVDLSYEMNQLLQAAARIGRANLVTILMENDKVRNGILFLARQQASTDEIRSIIQMKRERE